MKIHAFGAGFFLCSMVLFTLSEKILKCTFKTLRFLFGFQSVAFFFSAVISPRKLRGALY